MELEQNKLASSLAPGQCCRVAGDLRETPWPQSETACLCYKAKMLSSPSNTIYVADFGLPSGRDDKEKALHVLEDITYSTSVSI